LVCLNNAQDDPNLDEALNDRRTLQTTVMTGPTTTLDFSS